MPQTREAEVGENRGGAPVGVIAVPADAAARRARSSGLAPTRPVGLNELDAEFASPVGGAPSAVSPSINSLTDAETVRGVLEYLAEARPSAVLAVGTTVVQAQVLSMGEDGFSLRGVWPDDQSLADIGQARIEVHGVIFLLHGRVRLVEGGFRFDTSVRVNTLNRRATRRIKLPKGRARLLWSPVSSEAGGLNEAIVEDFAVDGVGLAASSESEVDLAVSPSRFPAMLELGGQGIACLAELRSTNPVTLRRGVRLRAPSGRTAMADAYLRYRFPKLLLRRDVDRRAVSKLFRSSGYLGLRAGTLPPDAWFDLPEADRLSRDVCYQAADGQIIGHTSATRAYSRAWLGHQIATLRDHDETVVCRQSIYLHIASYAALIDGDDTVMYGYFDRSKKWHQLFFGEFVRWVDRPEDAVIAELDRFERRDPDEPLPVLPALPHGAEVSAPTGLELLIATALVRAQLPELVAEAMDIDPERLASSALHPSYVGSPYIRQRTVLVLRDRGVLAGVALCEVGSRELSLFNLFNTAFFFFVRGQQAPAPNLQLGLLAAVRALYAQRGETNPLIVAPPNTFDASAEPGTILSETMGLIAKSGRALRQYEAFLDYHFGKHVAQQAGRRQPLK